MKEEFPKHVWANGVGLATELWFKTPRKFVLRTTKGNMGSEFQEYVPVGDKKSNFFDGGFWVEPKFGVYQNADCIVCVSKDREEVVEFTKVAKDILNFGFFWQKGFLEEWKQETKNRKKKGK